MHPLLHSRAVKRTPSQTFHIRFVGQLRKMTTVSCDTNTLRSAPKFSVRTNQPKGVSAFLSYIRCVSGLSRINIQRASVPSEPLPSADVFRSSGHPAALWHFFQMDHIIEAAQQIQIVRVRIHFTQIMNAKFYLICLITVHNRSVRKPLLPRKNQRKEENNTLTRIFDPVPKVASVVVIVSFIIALLHKLLLHCTCKDV